MRQYSTLDKIFISLHSALQTLTQAPKAARENPAHSFQSKTLSFADNRLSAQLMRVDHTGEICAQALYMGQALTARSDSTRQDLLKAAQEENDHLAWCAERLQELSSRASFLNPFWYATSFMIGMISGLAGDEWSMGFVVETEAQVEEHLAQHLAHLPEDDVKSHKILQTMLTEEVAHANHALNAGAKELPLLIKFTMKLMSKSMTLLVPYL